MQIQILSIQTLPKTSAKGKPYEALDIAFKNLTFQGKVEGKQLMPFGGNAPGFATLKNAQPGQIYDIAVVKNDAGYNDWTAATLSDGSAPAPSAAPQAPRGNASAPATTNSRGFETPEERAAKQVYIVRQSSLSAAVATLSVGGKSALKPADVIAVAGQYEAFVFGNGEATKVDDNGFSDMLDDIPT